MKTLIIDNYDSFTFNLYQALAVTNGLDPIVVRHDQVTLADLRRWDLDNVVISPGPGRPDRRADFGVCADVLLALDCPILGVCLGCQGVAAAFGGRVVAAPEPMHGRLSGIYHTDLDLFAGIPQGFKAVRYHSLIVDEPLPPDLQKLAWTTEGLIMGLRHATRPIWGVQFHPESICTEHGLKLLSNFRDLTLRHRAAVDACSSHALDDPMNGSRGRSPSIGQRFGKVEGERLASRSLIPRDSIVPHGVRQRATGSAPFWRKIGIWSDPEAVFVQLFGASSHAFWLDSSRVSPGQSRFSFMGAVDPEQGRIVTYDAGEQRVQGDGVGTAGGQHPAGFFDFMANELGPERATCADLPFDFQGGYVGYFGYEMKSECGSRGRHRSSYPDAAFLRADRLIAFDHERREIYLVCAGSNVTRQDADAWFDDLTRRLANVVPLEPLDMDLTVPPPGFVQARSRQDYLRDAAECQRLLAEGESYEICLTNQFTAGVTVDPLRYYRILRKLSPAPHAAFLRFGPLSVVSSSPERFLSIDRNRGVESKPIKGTARRGAKPDEDRQAREALRDSEKNRAENLMIVDLMRNDLGVVCETGSVTVPRLMEVESYATVHQLVSTVRGRLRPDVGPLDCIRQAFPAGSMTGAPKRRTMEILDRLETQARGVYSGALGWLGFNGTADMSVVIRTAVVTPGLVTAGAGGAVVALSKPAEEYAEMLLKTEALQRALGLAIQKGDVIQNPKSEIRRKS